MPLSNKERDLLAKLLELTRSDKEHEASAALGRAWAMLKRLKMTWKEALNPSDAVLFRFQRDQARLERDQARAELAQARAERDQARAELDPLRKELLAEIELQKQARRQYEQQRAALLARVAELERELRATAPKPDPWEAELSDFVARDGQDRYTAAYLITEVLGVPDRHINTDVYRRLGRCMRRLGDWQASNNIPGPNGLRVRGYQRPNPYHAPD